jgi:hypothetical protein
MGHVYYNAYVVFAANIDTTCTSPSGAEQIFGSPIVQAEIKLANSTRVLRHDSPLALHSGKLAGLKLPQSVRGWTLQESLMARRVLNFTQFEIFWICHRQHWCECFGASSFSLHEVLGMGIGILQSTIISASIPASPGRMQTDSTISGKANS